MHILGSYAKALWLWGFCRREFSLTVFAICGICRHPDGSTGPIAVILGGDFGDSVEPCSLSEKSRKSSDSQSDESDDVVNSKTAENGKLLIDVHPSPTECWSESSSWQDAYTCASKEYVSLSTYLPDGSSITSDYIFFKGPLQVTKISLFCFLLVVSVLVFWMRKHVREMRFYWGYDRLGMSVPFTNRLLCLGDNMWK